MLSISINCTGFQISLTWQTAPAARRLHHVFNIQNLRVFVAVAESGGIRGAAERLSRTPSAISMALKQLENEVGVPLFAAERKNALSALGRVVLDEGRDLLAHYERSRATVHAFARNESTRTEVACTPSIAVSFLPRIPLRTVPPSARATNAPPPGPRRSVSSPPFSSERSASRTVLRLTLNCSARSRSFASRSPVFRRPSLIWPRMAFATLSNARTDFVAGASLTVRTGSEASVASDARLDVLTEFM